LISVIIYCKPIEIAIQTRSEPIDNLFTIVWNGSMLHFINDPLLIVNRHDDLLIIPVLRTKKLSYY